MSAPRLAARRRGFSLVEVLAAMFVLAMGVLALAGLLQAAARHATMDGLRGTAVLLADDIADRMRANPAAAGAGGYDFAGLAFAGPPAPARDACTRAAPCTPAALAGRDLAEWTARVRASLPRGSARIVLHGAASPAPGRAQVWVGWADPLGSASRGAAEAPDADCPDVWTAAAGPVRCVFLQVAL